MLIDIFQNRAFSAIELTTTLNDAPYRPEFLGNFGEALFPTTRSRFRTIAVVKRKTGMALIPVSPIGAPPVELEGPSADVRPFFTRRLAKGSTVYAEELQGVLALPDFQQVVAGVAEELASRAVTIRADIETTHEHMRLGAIFGKVVDADGVRVLDDWFANWGVAEPVPFNFHLDVATTNVRSICTDIRDAMFNASPGSWVQGRTEVHALAGGTFFKLLTSHPTIERVYLNTQNALQLGQEQADVWEWGGITFHKYRGTPGGEFSVGDEEVRIFPLGARDAFSRVAGPAEFAPFINTPGQDVYGLTIPDRDRDAWARYEGYSYPLYVCLRPEMLQRGVAR
jgi:hypothetical protein